MNEKSKNLHFLANCHHIVTITNTLVSQFHPLDNLEQGVHISLSFLNLNGRESYLVKEYFPLTL